MTPKHRFWKHASEKMPEITKDEVATLPYIRLSVGN